MFPQHWQSHQSSISCCVCIAPSINRANSSMDNMKTNRVGILQLSVGTINSNLFYTNNKIIKHENFKIFAYLSHLKSVSAKLIRQFQYNLFALRRLVVARICACMGIRVVCMLIFIWKNIVKCKEFNLYGAGAKLTKLRLVFRCQFWSLPKFLKFTRVYICTD